MKFALYVLLSALTQSPWVAACRSFHVPWVVTWIIYAITVALCVLALCIAERGKSDE